jgi:hypothetical protein
LTWRVQFRTFVILFGIFPNLIRISWTLWIISSFPSVVGH